MKNRYLFCLSFACALTFSAGSAVAQQPVSVTAEMYKVSMEEDPYMCGTVTFTDIPDGVEISVDLIGLPAGEHGFHVHTNPDCSPMDSNGTMQAAGAAGGHYDPELTGKHLGPEGGGHKGDLPVLVVADDGTSKQVMTVKGVTATEFLNRSLMIHAGGDNYSDVPVPLGGGGARIGCGIIQVTQ